MKRLLRITSVLSSLFLCVSIISSSPLAAAFSGYGAGTSISPYKIATCAQLQTIDNDLAAYYTLISNIDCTGVTFTSLASSAAFTGTLDGLNHTISNLTISTSDGGLFYQTNGATIKNITIASGTITGNGNTGSFVGIAQNSTLNNLHSSATVSTHSGSAYVGGLVGSSQNVTTINGSSYSGTISGGSYIGGLVGYQGSLTPTADVLSNSYFDGTLNVAGTYVGGVMGILYSGTVQNTYSSGTINITGATTYLGGLIGISYKGATNNTFAASYINGTGTQFGAVYGIFYAIGGFTSTRSNNYFDGYRSNANDAHSLSCASTDQGPGTNCTEVNTSNATPLYFKNNHTNVPLNHASWDFVNTWSVTTGYPTLQNMQLFTSSSAPNSGDGNGDGIQDSYQANVLSVQDTNGTWVTVTIPSTSNCTLANGLSIANSSVASDTGFTSVVNRTGFTIYCPTNGAVVPVTIIYDKQYDTSKSVLRYYNASTQAFSTVSGATFSTRTVGGTVKSTVTYNVTDGGAYDEDGLANGIIKDPVGIATAPSAPDTGIGNPKTTSPISELGALSASLLLAAFLARKYFSRKQS